MREISFTEALREALREELARDANVFLMGEDIGVYGGAFGVTRGLLEQFGPARVLNTPISELGFVGAGIGAAITGMRPVVEIMFMDFIGLVVDPLVNQAAKLRYVFGKQARCPLVLRTASGGGRCYGPTHSQSLEAWFVHTPGLKVVAPSTPADAKGLLKSAIRDDNPVLFLEHKLLYGRRGPVYDDPDLCVPIGRSRVVAQGTDVTLAAWSWMTVEAERAVARLAADGISAALIDLRSLAPLDLAPVVESVKQTGRLVIVEECCRTGGVGAEVAQQVQEQAFEYMEAPVKRVATPDVPLSASPALEAAAMPDAERIRRAVMELIEPD